MIYFEKDFISNLLLVNKSVTSNRTPNIFHQSRGITIKAQGNLALIRKTEGDKQPVEAALSAIWE